MAEIRLKTSKRAKRFRYEIRMKRRTFAPSFALGTAAFQQYYDFEKLLLEAKAAIPTLYRVTTGQWNIVDKIFVQSEEELAMFVLFVGYDPIDRIYELTTKGRSH